MSTQTQACYRSRSNQWAHQLSMSTWTQAKPMGEISYNVSPWTQALNRSTPNHKAQSAINVSPQTQAHNRFKPNQWARSSINVSPQTQALNLSKPNQWAQSSTHSFRTRT